MAHAEASHSFRRPLTCAQRETLHHLNDDPSSTAFVEAWDGHDAAVAARMRVQRRRRALRIVREVAQTAALVAIVFFVTHSAVQGRELEGPSMLPTYHQGQRLFVNRLLYARIDLGRLSFLPFIDDDAGVKYLFHGPRRGEVIVFEPPFRNPDDLIKRVIGRPGDHVVVRDGVVTVNGQLLTEPYLHNVRTTCGGQWCDTVLGPDQYYVMGDNRPNSSDSRLWGPLPGANVIGKAWFIFSPIKDFGRAP